MTHPPTPPFDPSDSQQYLEWQRIWLAATAAGRHPDIATQEADHALGVIRLGDELAARRNQRALVATVERATVIE